MSNRRAIALSSMIGLHAQDAGESWATIKILRPAKDLIEAEERRRTFWFLFYADKWASSSSGKASGIRETEVRALHNSGTCTDLAKITTLLPTSEKAFRNGMPGPAQTLPQAIESGLDESVSSLTIAILSGCLLSELTAHLRLAQEDLKEQRDNVHGFWLRHQQLNHDIMKLIQSMPGDMRSFTTIDPLAIFLNMCLHGYLITLCQTASTFAQHSGAMESSVRLRSRARQAAGRVIETMRHAAFMNIRTMCSTTPSCLYLAASVFILDLRDGHEVEHAGERLRFILHIMREFCKCWKFSQIFLEQLLHNLKDYKINLEITAADLAPMKCLQEIGHWSALGPLFVTDPALVESISETSSI